MTFLVPTGAELRIFLQLDKEVIETLPLRISRAARVPTSTIEAGAIVVPRGAMVFGFVRRVAKPSSSAWELIPSFEAASPSIPVSLYKAADGCVELRNVASNAVAFIDGTEVPAQQDLFLHSGLHELSILNADDSVYTRPLLVEPSPTCQAVELDLKYRHDIWLVSLTIAPHCTSLGVEGSAVAKAISEEFAQLKEARERGRYQDGRHRAGVVAALGKFDRSLAVAGQHGPFSFGAPIEAVAKSLLGVGVGEALLVEVDCAGDAERPSMTLVLGRVRARATWDRASNEQLITEASHTVGAAQDLRTAIRVPLRAVMDEPRLELRAPFAWSYYRRGTLSVNVELPAQNPEALYLVAEYWRDVDGHCASLAEGGRLALPDPVLSPRGRRYKNTQRVTRTGAYHVAVQPNGAGRYVVDVTINRCGKKDASLECVEYDMRARERRCVDLLEPENWLRLEASAGAPFGNSEIVDGIGGLPARTATIEVGLTWTPQADSLALMAGVYAGYAFTSRSVDVPPGWDDLATSHQLYDQNELPFSWHRHSMRLGIVGQLNLDPGRHWNLGYSKGGPNARLFFELVPLLDVGFLDLSSVPDALHMFRGDSKIRPDADFSVVVKHGVGFRTTDDNEFDLMGLLELTAVDDFGEPMQGRGAASADAAFAGRLGAAWAFGL